MKKPTRTPLGAEQLADARRLSDIYKVRARESKARGDLPALTQTEVGEQCGWSSPQSTVSQYMNGKVALNLDALIKLARVLDFEPSEVSPSLAGGLKVLAATDYGTLTISPASSLGEKVDAYGTKSAVAEEAPSAVGLGDRYSFINQHTAKAAAGDGEENPHIEIRGVLAFKSDWLRAHRLNPKNLDVIYAEGGSMEPTINSGDVLLVDQSKIDPRDGQVFAMHSESKGTIVKRLVKSDFDGWIIRSDNPDKARYGDQVLRDDEINEVRIIGRVVWRGGML
ncbi:LexA family transcriptional regulator [Pseudomonas sp. Ost2]|uniref:XRE family transcriptional regulator n=1 Tax=Pseudomonas sp. Ost2 TaxID=2678260 RepID=UPI001BB43A30|nr:LexA family transcriptional regulator [Pseudomonas sp. Ost2]